jgi:transposase-like protein
LRRVVIGGQLALQHGLNTNMLFRWRRQLRAGLLDTTTSFCR